MDNNPPYIVKALHAYNPVNNDELKLAKDDIITVTNKEDGGWWEGTINGKIGWFPSNYVVQVNDPNNVEVGVEVNSPMSNGNSTSPSSFVSLDANSSSPDRTEYKLMVISDIIESENAHILELQGMWDNYLQPLRSAEILKPKDYEILIGNILDVLQNHTNILQQIKKEQTKPRKDQKIGKIFLESALKIETVHKSYCKNHPKAAAIIDKYKDKLQSFMESKGARHPGILVLIVALSQPFRRLEKYPTMLQELERHIEENHKDRGDLQRSIEYYKQIDKTCGSLRKQTDMELEVLNGTIKGWEGADISGLGPIHYLNSVLASTNTKGLLDLQPRYFVLFSNTLLILTYTAEAGGTSFVYEGKIPISGILLTNVPDSDSIINAFEITGPMLEPILVKCSSKEVKDTWIEHITNILKLNRFPSSASVPQSFAHLSPPVQAWNIARLRPTPPFNPFLNECLKNSSKSKVHTVNNKPDKSTSLPTMASLQLHQGNLNSNNFTSTAPIVTNEEDLAVLSIVDAFCTKTRQISVANNHITPVKPVHIQPPEKLPRSLVDLVMMLGEEVRSLKSQVANLSGQLELEQRSRDSLKSHIAKLLDKVQ